MTIMLICLIGPVPTGPFGMYFFMLFHSVSYSWKCASPLMNCSAGICSFKSSLLPPVFIQRLMKCVLEVICINALVLIRTEIYA